MTKYKVVRIDEKLYNEITKDVKYGQTFNDLLHTYITKLREGKKVKWPKKIISIYQLQE